jgi:hypothetical protein
MSCGPMEACSIQNPSVNLQGSVEMFSHLHAACFIVPKCPLKQTANETAVCCKTPSFAG